MRPQQQSKDRQGCLRFKINPCLKRLFRPSHSVPSIPAHSVPRKDKLTVRNNSKANIVFTAVELKLTTHIVKCRVCRSAHSFCTDLQTARRESPDLHWTAARLYQPLARPDAQVLGLPASSIWDGPADLELRGLALQDITKGKLFLHLEGFVIGKSMV